MIYPVLVDEVVVVAAKASIGMTRMGAYGSIELES
jgi:hypothetical protein